MGLGWSKRLSCRKNGERLGIAVARRAVIEEHDKLGRIRAPRDNKIVRSVRPRPSANSNAICTSHPSSGTFKTFPEHDRALVVMTREQALAVSGSVAASLYLYQEPVLRLRDKDKHLLSEAMFGETDTELAAKLNLSLSTVKKRWNSLFARFAEVRPDLLPEADARESESRGLQKRHRILAYVRAHPQEVRPYRWRSFKQV
jgi:hypothetical protein